ncbi:hypothetical protein Mgra_00005385 [Meloidogyne graminicola]|uniref:Heat shock 70 kDa protein 4L n=1 Tax=Meloidogyne graminicola TaxID=189291 RepID=A0A8S9ZPD8_9BILA|nr:hypothetical protein Mgra_00005385 [Meloidogyne graminicola]
MAGIDFGNMNCYLAAARNKGIEVLMNDYSLHATPYDFFKLLILGNVFYHFFACILFGQTSRHMGFGARQQLNMHYKNTVLNFKQLLGKQYSDLLGSSIPCDVTQLKNGDLGFKLLEVFYIVMYLNEEKVFSPEQVLACLFTHLRLLLSKSLEADVNECVMSVPYYFDENQRLAIFAAGKIASLKIHLINDHAALAYNYGIYNGMSLPKTEDPSKIVAFIDCGHSCIQSSLIAFNVGRAKVISAAHSIEVGGHYFDMLLRDHFVVQFKEKYNIDVTKNPKAMFRLLDECEKKVFQLKKQMSANSQNIPFQIECFMNDVDVSGSMQRTQFEEMGQHLFEKINLMLKALIDKSQINIEDISDVEIIGGSSRIPRIKQIIGAFFNKEPRTTMNQDDAIARGCALRSAMFYPIYQMKEFTLEDPFELIIDNSKMPNEKSLAELIKIEIDMQAADRRATERKIAEELRLSCLNECQTVLEWLDMNSTELQKKQIECRHFELEKHCKPALNKLLAAKNNVTNQENNNQNNNEQPMQDNEVTFEEENIETQNLSSNTKLENNKTEMEMEK